MTAVSRIKITNRQSIIVSTVGSVMAIVDNCDTVSNGFIRFQIQSETVQQNETIALEVKTAQDHFRDLTKMI